MVRDLLGQASESLRFNRRRTALTMLGMAWGIATVVILLAYGAGFERAVVMIFESWGTNMILVIPGRTSMQAGGQKAGAEVKLKLVDVQHVQEEVPLVKRVSPVATLQKATVLRDTRFGKFDVNGVYPFFQSIRKMDVEYGREMNLDDENNHARVAILGDEVKGKLFSGEQALGDNIRINGITFQVIGIMKHKIQDGNNNDNHQIYIPFTAMGDLKNTEYIDFIVLDYEGNHYKVADGVRKVLAGYHNFDVKDKRAVYVEDIQDDLAQFRVITTAIKVLLAFIGALTLGIGGVGLMNIMLVSVTQRTREIGVEKALGARKRDILFQFLSEALAITLLGGVLGVAFAYLVSYTVGALPLMSALSDSVKNGSEGDIHLTISSGSLLVSTVILGLVGVVSGMLPAIKAARLDPVEALRYE